MFKFLFLVLSLSLAAQTLIPTCHGFFRSAAPATRDMKLQFNPKNMIPGIKKNANAQVEAMPEPDFSNRFQLRLIKTSSTGTNKRHIITRLVRYFPDMVWETAAGIVDSTLLDDMATIRFLNSIDAAEEYQKLLFRADPPVISEIFDVEKGAVC